MIETDDDIFTDVLDTTKILFEMEIKGHELKSVKVDSCIKCVDSISQVLCPLVSKHGHDSKINLLIYLLNIFLPSPALSH